MIAELIVIASTAATVAFVILWLARPDLRAWIERPKYRFLDAAQAYDRARPTGSDGRVGGRSR